MTVTPMEGALIFFGSIAVLGLIVVLLDAWGRRKDRQQQGPAR